MNKKISSQELPSRWQKTVISLSLSLSELISDFFSSFAFDLLRKVEVKFALAKMDFYRTASESFENGLSNKN